MSPDIFDNELFPSSYSVLRHDRDVLASERKRGGGVLLAINSKCNVTPINVSFLMDVSPLINVIACKCLFKLKTIIIVALYIPPDMHASLLEEFFIKLETLIIDRYALIIGDFNVPYLTDPDADDKKSLLCRDFLNVTNLAQCNTVLNMSGRCLDLVLTNLNPSVVRSDSPFFTEESHHPALNVNFNYKPNGTSMFPIKISCKQYIFKDAPLYDLYMTIANEDWVSIIENADNVDQALDAFYARLTSLTLWFPYTNNSGIDILIGIRKILNP